MDAKSSMEKIQESLDNYERGLGLLSINTIDSAEINNYFSMTRDQINQLNPLDCNEISTRLIQYAFYIQRQHNVEQSRLSWSNCEILKYACDKTDQVGGQYTKFDAKIYLLSKQDEYISRLVAIRDYAQTRIDRLTYLATSIRNLADVFSSCAKTKIGMREK